MEPSVICLDCETTTYNNGSPFDIRNRLVCTSWCNSNGEYGAKYFDSVHPAVGNNVLVVGFNFKFDFHWFRNTGLDLSLNPIWDVQFAHFVLSGFQDSMVSLDEVLEKYGLDKKHDQVKEYWKRGVDTQDIPPEILLPYAEWDAVQTYKAYLYQRERLTEKQRRLVLLAGQDIPILAEMEMKGTKYDEDLCRKKSQELNDKIQSIQSELQSLYPDVPINWNSGDHLSAVLYGGKITEIRKVHAGFYKTGVKAGQPKFSNMEVTHELPRLFEPLRGSELKKEGFYETNEGVLRKLPRNKHYFIVEKLLELAKLDKLNGTYYKGLVELNREQNWEPGILHGQYNIAVARSGRLSSSKPNMQNFASDLQDILISKYNE